MADSAVQRPAGLRPRAAGASRRATGTKTSALRPEDASKRKAELEAAVKKKIEFERKALHIVEQLLEENITEDFLVECGKFITPAHYSDVVVERSIINFCGYPLCQKKLGIVPKQKYKISTKTNKVYDITERKSFCSNFCYKASKYFEAQIPKTPVWVREEDRQPDFQLLKEGQSGHSGEEVQLCSKAIKTSDIDNLDHFEKQYESSSSNTCSDSSSDNEQDFVSSVLPGNRPNTMGKGSQLHKKTIMKKKAGQKTNSTLFLYGQKYASVCLKPSSACLVNEELDEDDINSDSYNHSLAFRGSQNSLDQSLPFRGSDTAIKPLPSYESLKKETETFNLRIREFYRGQYVLSEVTTVSQDSEEHDPTFPLIDSSSQNQIRKRIVLEKLSKVLPGLLGPLQITLGDIYSQLKNLVRTFRLTNRNIIHNPVEWTLIAMVLLSLLNSALGIQTHSQKNVLFTQFIATMLEELHLKNEDLESLTIIFRTGN
ncbi:putative RNA polymerase II subunit B1 CTD phosphatase RPAP2 [Octodon degus]|uniref:RNA polymerase II subunit B1 CTD phosphatase RPAP2 homolog n=1 Tax=Octodon degus TaxID=10160 RepID=A0A6P6EUQ4_OCTDE|nr:putative RNA polymerase II subunit B1 CTD phosphatase RPAP2 [Octodon degus]